MINRIIRSKRRGQAIVIIAGALVALIALVALAIDGGNAYAQRRNAQNAVDGAAVAGITKMSEIFIANRFQDCDTHPGICVWKVSAISTGQNRDIMTAMLQALQAASTNANTIGTTPISGTIGTMDLRYIDTDGHVYGPRMTAPNVTVPFAGGEGRDNPNSNGAAGVWVTTTSSAGTYFARIIGVDQVTADAHAGARIGGASGISPVPQVPNASGVLNQPILWPITVVMTGSTNYSTQDPTILYGNPNSTRNWADLSYTASETNGAGCDARHDDFTCFMENGFKPSDETPFRGFAELQHNSPPLSIGDPDLAAGPVQNHRIIPLGSDGVAAPNHNSTGIWIAGTPGNQVASTGGANSNANKVELNFASLGNWPVFVPISDRSIVIGGQYYYHVTDVAVFEISAQHCCTHTDDITGIFRGYGWAAGNATYSNRLDKAVIDGQTVIQLGP